ncbi:hypothetical protein OG900_28855 [Streptomyces sp. NBC_00433]
MDAEVVQLMEQVGPYLSTALGAYGAAVLTRAEDAVVDAGADGSARLGRRILHAVWRQREEPARAALEGAVSDAAAEPQDADAAAALRQQVKKALQEDQDLRRELARLLAAAGAGTVNVTASGERAIAAQHIGTAITGDNATVRP